MNSKPAIQKLALLLIEDNPGDARLIHEYLADPAGSEFELHHRQNLQEGLARLADGDIALVLLDLTLPDSTGFETFTRLQATAQGVPVVVLSGQDDEALAVKTVHAGAQDYLVKGRGLDTRLLVRSIRYAIERKATEEALAKERDLLHTLLDNLPDRIYFKDHRSRFLRISRAVAQQFKLSDPRLAIGKTDSDFFAAEHAEAARQDEARVMATGEPLIGKVEREKLPDGSITWALTSKLPLRAKDGRIIGNFGISRDITELKRYEDALATERNLLRSLIDNLPDYIYVKNTAGEFLLDNIAHRRFLGASREEEIVGKSVYDLLPRDSAQEFTRDDAMIFETGQALLNREEHIPDPMGNLRWHSTTKVPLRAHDGHLIGLVGISRDITERKQAEQELQQANSQLALKHQQLQSALDELQKSHDDLKAAQFQLIQAEKMQSVGRLAAGVAHEVKNPLAILNMGIEYLTKNLSTPDESIKLILTDMTDALHRADSIIMGLLDFSVPRALDLRGEDLNAAIEQALNLVRYELSQGPIKLETELAPDLPVVWVDKNKIQQVLVNILTNAIQAIALGGVLTVRSYSRRLEAGELAHDSERRWGERFRVGESVAVVEVLDTGPGVPPDKLPKAFDPFFTTKPAGKGTGLGLTVARKIVELHGGMIDLRNRPEGGAIVTLLFKI